MVQHSPARLDASFAALSDATRRGVLSQLGRADASITELADRFHMTVTGMKKHVGVLERAGLVATEKVGRVRTCTLGPSRLQAETAWMEGYRQLWAARFDELDRVIGELKEKEKRDERRKNSEPNAAKNPTTVEPKSEREVVVTRTFDAPSRIVFQAWTTPALFKRWWVPKSMPLALLSYEADIRTGGSYRLVFRVDDTKTMAFFGTYIEVTPHSRIVWTNDESGEDGALTTVTLEEQGDKTRMVLHELYRTKEARDAALASGAYGGMPETFGQLDEVLVTL